jgi:hypothetical protein
MKATMAAVICNRRSINSSGLGEFGLIYSSSKNRKGCDGFWEFRWSMDIMPDRPGRVGASVPVPWPATS